MKWMSGGAKRQCDRALCAVAQEHRDFYSSKVRQFHTHLAMTDDASDDNGQARLRDELNREDLVRIIQELSQIGPGPLGAVKRPWR
jgi:hypothetical protein